MSLLSLGIASIPRPAPQQKDAVTLTIDEVIRRVEAMHQTLSGIAVSPESCMESPTVHSIVTGVSRRIASLPVNVLQKTVSKGRTRKEPLPNHPVQRLLNKPNDWQSRTDYWLDATSYLLRYGRYYAFKAQGKTGPIRRLIPLAPYRVTGRQNEDWSVVYDVTQPNGSPKPYQPWEIHYARGPARDGFNGDSPVNDCREAIACEIAAQKFGGSFFGGGALPGLVFEFMEGVQGFQKDEERQQFVRDYQALFSGSGRFKAMLMPKGIKVGSQVGVEPEKAQFIQTRGFLRNVIAGAWGIPPFLVGDLEHQTFNNAEQQSIELIIGAILPFLKIFESAMERDLLTTDDRNGGVIIRFNVDAALRGDFKTRQEGLKIQRENGVINPNEWRELENLNPREGKGGEQYWDTGPSGQNQKPGKPPANPEGEPNA